MTIALILEDDRPTSDNVIQALVDFDLVQAGEVAHSVRQAIDASSAQPFDLVISDQSVEGPLKGLHFHRWLVQQGSPLADRFLFMGDTQGDAADEAYIAEHHIPRVRKPFTLTELKEAVERCMATVGSAD